MSSPNASSQPKWHREPTKYAGIRAYHRIDCRRASKPDARCTCAPRYEARVYVPTLGRRVDKTFTNLSEARSWQADTRRAAERNEVREPSRRTLSEAAAEWIEGARSGAVRSRSRSPYKPSALRGYERQLRLRVLPALGRRRLTDITRHHVQALADGWLAAGDSPSTVHNALDPLRAIYRRAVQRDEVRHNPCERLDLPSSQGRRERVADPAEAALLIAALPAGERALWATALYGGLRRGELRALRYSDLHLDARRIRVSRAWDDDEGEIAPKSRAGTRTIPILGPLRPLLAAHALATGRRDGDLVFGRTAREPFEPSTVRRRALDAWAAAGLTPIGLHEARHTCASLLIASGANIKVVQSVLGHATITMTLDRYGHLMPDSLDDLTAEADAWLERKAGGRRAAGRG